MKFVSAFTLLPRHAVGRVQQCRENETQIEIFSVFQINLIVLG